MRIHTNCSVDKILDRYNMGKRDKKTLFLIEMIFHYKDETEKEINSYIKKYKEENPATNDKKTFMIWCNQNVPVELRGNVRNKYLGVPINVLKRSTTKYKTLSQIGIAVDIQGNDRNTDYLEQWDQLAEKMMEFGPFYETHAHYNLGQYNKNRAEVLEKIRAAGVAQCIIPSVEAYKSGHNLNQSIKEMFDAYEWVWYAFASHPKYLWKDCEWTAERWDKMEELLSDPKCVAVGETGLDYSYPGFDREHQSIQKHFFSRFITLANKHKLPLILHFRPGAFSENADYKPNVNDDAIRILSEHPVGYGAVVHCFGGDEKVMRRYLDHGVEYFGIGGRILYGEVELEKAVKAMPAQSILLETDSPYINSVEGISGPNISVSLMTIAQRIAELRGMSVQELIRLTYKNAKRLFGN